MFLKMQGTASRKVPKGTDRIMAGQNSESGEFDRRLTRMNADGERTKSKVSHTYRWQVTEKDPANPHDAAGGT